MTTQFTVYQSTDGSAPTLSGTAGELIAILDACLINGYGSKSAAGWSKVYSGTNKAVYRAPNGNRFYLRVTDDGTGSAAYARAIAYESMSGVDTGTGPFPTDAQQTGGFYWHKSNGANSTQRYWCLIANDRTLYFFSAVSGTSTTNRHLVGFGDFQTLVAAGDSYSSFIVGATSTTSTTGHGIASCVTSMATAQTDIYIPRPALIANGTTSVAAGKTIDAAKSKGATTIGSGGIPYPGNTGGEVLSPIWLNENGDVRGTFPGLWAPLHALPLSDLATYSGAGDMAGKTFLAITPAVSSAQGQIHVETSNTISY